MTHCTTSLERKDNGGDWKKKGEEVRKGEWEAKDLHRPNAFSIGLRQVQYSEVELTHCTTSLERKDNGGNWKKKGAEIGKEEWEA